MTSSSGINVIAEIGCNHKGNMDIACEMIEIAARDCKVEAVKFQKRHNRSLLPTSVYDAPHPVPANSYGRTYGEHREFLEFTLPQHKELMEECQRKGIVYSTSVWDVISAEEITSLRPEMIKVPSATNQNFEVQEFLCRNFDGEIHVSMGMTTRDEVDTCISFYEKMGRAKDVVLYACTSGYPVPPSEVCLLEINALQQRFGDRVKAYGFSGHHEGIAIDMAAAAIGTAGVKTHASSPFAYIERHFTLDRSWKGTDHAASLEPDDLAKLRSNLHDVCSAVSSKYTDVLDIEVEQRRKLKWVDMSEALRRKALLNKVS